jgi:hypothetical protein
MRLFIIAAIVCFVIALLGELGVFTGVAALTWVTGGLLAWAIDAAVGGYVLPIGARRPPSA